MARNPTGPWWFGAVGFREVGVLGLLQLRGLGRLVRQGFRPFLVGSEAQGVLPRAEGLGSFCGAGLQASVVGLASQQRALCRMPMLEKKQFERCCLHHGLRTTWSDGGPKEGFRP